MTITLTGFMGCGKSSVGRYLSELLCCPFTDLDEAICQKAGKSIPEIFTSEGEAGFRTLEAEVLQSILSPSGAESTEKQSLTSQAMGPSLCGQMASTASPSSLYLMIVALGGGTVMTPECAELVKEKTTCIYLKASIETLIRHLETEASGRPMLQGDSLRSRIEELMSIRSETYETTAHITIETDGKSIEAIAEEIFHILNN
jgi:shikimate kinase